MLACSGAAALLTRGWTRARGDQPPPLAALAAGVCYAWNPFVAERLLIGQWALLLGYAGLPWVVRSLCTGQGRISLARLCGALLPAAIGGFGAMGISALAAVPAAWFGGPAGAPATGRIRRLATALLALALLSLPWLIPALLVPVHTDPRGAQAFAARPDTPFGRVGSLLMLSGIWNAQTVPRGYGGPSSAVWLLVVLVALGGYALIARPKRICPGLGVAAAAGLAIAAIGVSAPGRAALSWLVGAWPGFAVLRDGQEYLAPLALAEAVGLGAAVAWLMRGDRAARAPAVPAAPARAPAVPAAPAPADRPAAPAARAPARRAVAALGVMAVLAPVLLLPGLAWGSAGRLRAVHYPADWLAARRIIDGDRGGGTVVLLPWAAYRRYPWNGREAVYDPWSRFLRREVISNDELQVGRLTLAPESAASNRLNRIVRAPGALTGPLRGAGVRYVVIDAGPLLAHAGAGPGGTGAAAGGPPGPGQPGFDRFPAPGTGSAAGMTPEGRYRAAPAARQGPTAAVSCGFSGYPQRNDPIAHTYCLLVSRILVFVARLLLALLTCVSRPGGVEEDDCVRYHADLGFDRGRDSARGRGCVHRKLSTDIPGAADEPAALQLRHSLILARRTWTPGTAPRLVRHAPRDPECRAFRRVRRIAVNGTVQPVSSARESGRPSCREGREVPVIVTCPNRG